MYICMNLCLAKTYACHRIAGYVEKWVENLNYFCCADQWRDSGFNYTGKGKKDVTLSDSDDDTETVTMLPRKRWSDTLTPCKCK